MSDIITPPPREQLLTEAEVLRVLTISRTSLHRWIKSGFFPEPLQLGPRRIAWSAAAVDDWVEERRAVRPHARRSSAGVDEAA